MARCLDQPNSQPVEQLPLIRAREPRNVNRAAPENLAPPGKPSPRSTPFRAESRRPRREGSPIDRLAETLTDLADESRRRASHVNCPVAQRRPREALSPGARAVGRAELSISLSSRRLESLTLRTRTQPRQVTESS